MSVTRPLIRIQTKQMYYNTPQPNIEKINGAQPNIEKLMGNLRKKR